jgi:hypothetical protein
MRSYVSLFLFFVLTVSTALPCTPVWSTSKTDTFAQGSPPTLPAAGSTYCDPVFGTEILRVTDSSTDGGANFGTAYSYWPTFNSDNTKILAVSGSNARIFDFNPTTKVLGSSIAAPSGVVSYEHGVYWSRTNPNYLYGVSGLNIRRLDVSVGSPAWSTIRTYTEGDVGTGAANFIQIHLSDDDSRMSATVTNSSDTKIGIAAFMTTSVSTLYYEATSNVDEVQIDKSGVYLVHKTGVSGANQIEVRVINVDTDTVVDLEDDSPDYSPGHSDNGSGVVVGMDDWRNSITWRTLASPQGGGTELITDPTFNVVFGHLSMRKNGDDWALVSNYDTVQTEKFNNEIFFLKTDQANAEVRRFVKHYSGLAYEELPKANVSMDGKFVAFTSNMLGGSSGGRQDLYIAYVPSGMGIWSDAPPALKLGGAIRFSGSVKMWPSID